MPGIVKDLAALAFPVAKLDPLPGNPRVGDVDAVARSYEAFGQRKPIVARRRPRGRGTVIAGNHQLAAAKRLGWAEIAVVWVDDDDTMAQAYALADNHTAELGGYDDQALLDMLTSVHEGDRALFEATAFTDRDLARLLASQQPQDGRDTEPREPPADPKTRRGDLYLLGAHRLLCGDATSLVDVQLLFDNGPAGLLVTDPPYGVDYRPEWRQEAAEAGHLAYAASRVGHVANDDRADWTEAWEIAGADVAYVWHADRHASTVQASLEQAGYVVRNQLIWSKPHFPISRGHYNWRHEPCWYAVRAGATARWCGDAKQTTVWEVGLDRNVDGGHSTQKPLELMARPIRNHEFETVYDPFVGSGTTLIAAENLGRACYAMEIDPAYVDVVVDRWERHTGARAKLAARPRRRQAA
jgi:DNA modification methylase